MSEPMTFHAPSVGAELQSARADAERLAAAHAALDDVGAPSADGDLAGRVRVLASDLEIARAAVLTATAVGRTTHAALTRTEAERDALRASLDSAHTAFAEINGAPTPDGDLAAGIRALGVYMDRVAHDRKAERALRDSARTNTERLAVDLARAETERDALKARLAERPAPADPRDPPTETAAETAIRRLRAYLSDRNGFDYTGANYDGTDFVEVAIREFRESNKTIRSYQDRLERAERISLEQLQHRLRGT